MTKKAMPKKCPQQADIETLNSAFISSQHNQNKKLMSITSTCQERQRVYLSSSPTLYPNQFQLKKKDLLYLLQEIIRYGLLRRHAPRILRRGLKYPIPAPGSVARPLRQYVRLSPTGIAVRAAHVASVAAVLTELQDRSDVAAAVAVVRRAPDGHDGTVEHFFEAFHDELVGARDQREVVLVVEALHDVGAEEEAGAARREAPSVDFVRVGP